MAAVISRNDPAFDEALLDRASVAFGVFDGVHEGHRFIIGEAVNTAREEGRASAVITFDIDPDEVFAADRLKKLMTNEARIAKLAELDVDAVVVLPFSREFAAQSPEDFLDACFGGGVPEAHIHIGSDFHFGRKAAGNVESLRVWGAERGMEVHGHELLSEGGRPVTATRIRGLLSEGRAREAADLLGRPYELSGLVRPGPRRGSRLRLRHGESGGAAHASRRRRGGVRLLCRSGRRPLQGGRERGRSRYLRRHG